MNNSENAPKYLYFYFEVSDLNTEIKDIVHEVALGLSSELMVRIFDDEPGLKNHYLFIVPGETTQGVELVLPQVGKAYVTLPPYSSMPDVCTAFWIMHFFRRQNHDIVFTCNDEEIQLMPYFFSNIWHDCLNNYITAIVDNVYTIVSGQSADYRISTSFLQEHHPDIENPVGLAIAAINDYAQLVSTLINSKEFGAGKITEPGGEDELSVYFVSNRDGYGASVDRLVVSHGDSVKVVDFEDFFLVGQNYPDNIVRLDPDSFVIRKLDDDKWEELYETLPGREMRDPKTYLLRWNPAISSFKKEYHDDAIERFGPNWGMDWSIWEHEEAYSGDRFYMLREGDGVDPGIYYCGHFSSEPYTGDDWRGTGKKRYYVDIECFGGRKISEGPWIKTEELEAAIPEINWRIGHSGELLTEDVVKKLDTLWEQKFKG